MTESDWLLRTGRIVSVAPDGSDLRAESDTVRSYFAPDVDRAGRVVVAALYVTVWHIYGKAFRDWLPEEQAPPRQEEPATS